MGCILTYIRISNHDTQHNKNFQGFCELLRLCMAKQDKTFSAFWCKSKVHLSSNILLWDIKKEILELTSVFTDIYKYEFSSCWNQILLLFYYTSLFKNEMFWPKSICNSRAAFSQLKVVLICIGSFIRCIQEMDESKF